MSSRQKTILFAVLNWGLGHASRSIPVIKALRSLGHRITLASDGVAKKLLEKEMPDMVVCELPSYNINYSGRSFTFSMVKQLPKINQAIAKENKAVCQLVHEYNIDLIISDNRYGANHPEIPSILITHQLELQFSNPILKKTANLALFQFLQKFNSIWVPDHEGPSGIANALANRKKNLIINYIGPLSRFEEDKSEKLVGRDLLFVLSGPEPDRTNFEKLILEQTTEIEGVLVRGTETPLKDTYNSKLIVKNLIGAKELSLLFASAKLIVARSGYSTLMDLYHLGRKALLVPTLGQTEQEYLAEEMQRKKLFKCVKQSEINLERDIPLALNFPGFMQNRPAFHLKDKLEDLINT